MILTGIGAENKKAFEPLWGKLNYKKFDLCVGAIEEDTAAGVAFFSEFGDSLFLDYIYVARRFRRRGIGRALIDETLAALDEIPFVALHVNYPEYADDLHRFILSQGFKIFRDGTAYRTKISDLLGSKTADKLLSGPIRDRVIKVSELAPSEKKILKKSLNRAELDPQIIDDASYSDKLSLAALDKENGEPAGLVLCRLEPETIVISYLINFSDDPVILLDVLRELKKIAVKEKLTEYDLVFLTMTDDMAELPRKLLGSEECLHKEGAVISGIRMFLQEKTRS